MGTVWNLKHNMKLFALTILSLLVTLTTVVDTRKTYRRYRRVKSYNPAPQNYNQVHYLQYLGNLTENAPEKHPLGGKVYFRKDDESVIRRASTTSPTTWLLVLKPGLTTMIKVNQFCQ